jgi:hypothetical protein
VAIGLMPSNTGEPGGKRTGQQMTHYVIEGGPFDLAFRTMPPAFLLPWSSGRAPDPTGKPKAKKDKVKYTCPVCAANVWGKPDLVIVCGECGEPFSTEAVAEALVSVSG